MAPETPDYGKSDHAEIIGYNGTDGKWHFHTDDDWEPPTYDDMEVSEHYLIKMDTRDGPENMPGIVQWYGLIFEDIPLDDIYDYYVSHYENLAG